MGIFDLIGLAPFNPDVNKPISLPGGSQATEYSATSLDPSSGKYVVHPQIWFSGQEPRYLEGENGLEAALIYELNGGAAFPRFDTAAAADAWASGRSDAGGGLLSNGGPQ
jgi:hypothetical protein